jgi:hypothetical protein
MVTNNSSISSMNIYDSTEFKNNQKSRLNDIKNNTKEVASDIQQREQVNASVEQTIQSDVNKYARKTDSDIRAALMRQLNSPFPLVSTEVLLKTI